MDDIVPILKNRAKKSRPTDSLFELDVVRREWNRYLGCMTWNKEFEFQIRQEIRLKYASRARLHGQRAKKRERDPFDPRILLYRILQLIIVFMERWHRMLEQGAHTSH